MVEYWSHTKPTRQDKVLVPLCGKSEDLVWLATKHEEVQGVELSLIAVRAFFAEHFFYTPMVVPMSGQHELYQFDELSIYTGDFFTAPLKPVDIVYDRASLVALPKRDASRLRRTNQKACSTQEHAFLLVTLDYDQSLMAGPPFAVPEQEVRQLFDGMKNNPTGS
ncbi:thiopurine S-methyltransferase [Vibrio sinaloensis]|nr:thiopurine S-methyltransferase [Vibrio sinaloensis]